MNIYVGNLPLEVTQEILRQEFVPFGQVTGVNIMNDSTIGSGQSRVCGFVEMPLESEAQAAITGLQGKTLNGHMLSIIKALPLTKAPPWSGYLGINGFSRIARHSKR